MEIGLLSIADIQSAVSEAACSYDIMISALTALNHTNSADGMVDYIHNNQLIVSTGNAPPNAGSILSFLCKPLSVYGKIIYTSQCQLYVGIR